jgi:hypothetical protein
MMKSRASVLAIPMICVLAACGGDQTADDATLPALERAVERTPDVPGAPGSITTDVDRPPRPVLAPDTLPSPPAEPSPNPQPR